MRHFSLKVPPNPLRAVKRPVGRAIGPSTLAKATTVMSVSATAVNCSQSWIRRRFLKIHAKVRLDQPAS